ncbi:helicase-related protein, partial [Pseudomonas viridiflava]
PPMIKLISGQKPAETTDHDENEQENESGSRHAIAAHLYKFLRGSNNLIFPNSRDKVEWYADRLRHLCEKDGLPNEFFPHHGSLSRDLREDTERALKAGTPPASAVCTTTLELGIDIGNIRTVAQINS